ncbi:hypothetical protein NGR_c17570 [Sinorhizobium fredii NGR234]|uniref:Uncharacterized protein n=1 Tax=Sinorhizobium fredii (strain NBRC 101917 / NGR234) TaxID=394 RepID=C3MDK2_SINFN|nr:hypothetical protein NGR_c17570 [Sinorhizobium fredii NGR234]
MAGLRLRLAGSMSRQVRFFNRENEQPAGLVRSPAAGDRRAAGAPRRDVIGTAVGPLAGQACERVGRPLHHADIAANQPKLDGTVPQHLMHASPPEEQRPGQVRAYRDFGSGRRVEGPSRTAPPDSRDSMQKTSSAIVRFRAAFVRVGGQGSSI